jgi:uncharacterized protein YdhG (YjbR/CyaY superfamily)
MTSVDDYIAGFSESIREKLQLVRRTIQAHTPGAEESISYGMPAYTLNKKPLVYFGGFAKHIGFYATPTGHQKFNKALSKYKQGKGSVQFPLAEPVPVDLIARIVAFRVEQNNN